MTKRQLFLKENVNSTWYAHHVVVLSLCMLIFANGMWFYLSAHTQFVAHKRLDGFLRSSVWQNDAKKFISSLRKILKVRNVPALNHDKYFKLQNMYSLPLAAWICMIFIKQNKLLITETIVKIVLSCSYVHDMANKISAN